MSGSALLIGLTALFVVSAIWQYRNQQKAQRGAQRSSDAGGHGGSGAESYLASSDTWSHHGSHVDSGGGDSGVGD